MRRRGRGKGNGGKVSEGTLEGKHALQMIISDDLWRYTLEFLGPDKEEEDRRTTTRSRRGEEN